MASVRFLAAGVSHEINNPLNIISGYAELSHRKLRRSPDPDAVNDALQTLQIIRDEAFRCKGITEKLLSLSTPADRSRWITTAIHFAGTSESREVQVIEAEETESVAEKRNEGRTASVDPYALPPEDVQEPPATLWQAPRKIGPGIILAGSIIGSDELILTTSLGAQYGFLFL